MSEKAGKLVRGLLAQYIGRKPKTISLKLSWDDGSPLFKAILITINNIPSSWCPTCLRSFREGLDGPKEITTVIIA